MKKLTSILGQLLMMALFPLDTIAAESAPYYKTTIYVTCEDHDNQRSDRAEVCTIPMLRNNNTYPVFVSTPLSATVCTYTNYRDANTSSHASRFTYGYDDSRSSNVIKVWGGCRAIFRVAIVNTMMRDIKCESWSYRKNRCSTSKNIKIIWVKERLSRSDCTNRTGGGWLNDLTTRAGHWWHGNLSNYIKVNDGCRATFSYVQLDSSSGSGSSGSSGSGSSGGAGGSGRQVPRNGNME